MSEGFDRAGVIFRGAGNEIRDDVQLTQDEL